MANHVSDPAEDIGKRLEFETLIADLSSRFINLPADEVDREIEAALSSVCRMLDIDYAVLWQWSPAFPDIIAPTHTYYALEGPSPAGLLTQDQFPWYRQQMLAGRTVVVSSLDDLPEAAAVDRDCCQSLGVRSNLSIPLSMGGEPPDGALGLNTVRVQRDWPDTLVNRLQLVAQVFTNALARKRHELERQELLARLQQAEERLGLAADSADAGLWSLDFRTGIIWATQKALAIFGYLPSEAVSLERFELSVHLEEREFVHEAVERSRRNGERVDIEYRILTPDGRVHWVSTRGRTTVDSSGKPDRLMGVSTDITERRFAEERIRQSEANLASGAELAGLGFYWVDFGKGTAHADDRIRMICGMPPGPDNGLNVLQFWMEHLHPDDRQMVLAEREHLHSGRVESLSMEYRFLHPLQGVRWVHHLARISERDSTGATLRSYGVLRDVTARRQAEEELRKSFEEIARLNERLQAEGEYLKAELNLTYEHAKIIGQSVGIRKVLQQAEQVGPTDTSVLVSGETGTGKELIAQSVHRLSPRRDHPMVKINCGVLPAGLIESELFGREKGAFTGAMARQVGRFEIADGSTIFLDEIGELPIELQPKLLRVLESGEFERLGSPRTIKVNVRVIAATNRDLPTAIRQGKFREDLYYRLNVFPIRLPPLRERAEDIPLLVWRFLGEFSSRMGKRITRVQRTTMDALQRHSWPGNVRELRNVIEHAVIITPGDTLRLPIFDDEAPAAASEQTLAEAEHAHILRTLEKTGWRVKGPKGAAAKLGINPSTLVNRMKKQGILPRREPENQRV
jgi:formate hydrogenlyase transcriptional activator